MNSKLYVKWVALPDYFIVIYAILFSVVGLSIFSILFYYGQIDVSMGWPRVIVVTSCLIGGMWTIPFNMIISLFYYSYYLGGDRLLQAQSAVVVAQLISGFVGSLLINQTRRAEVNQAKAALVDSSNGNIKKLWIISTLLKNVDDNWGTKTGLQNLEAARGMADDLATMVKGWRILAMEKQAIIKDDTTGGVND